MIFDEVISALKKKELEADFENFEYKNLKINGKVLVKDKEHDSPNQGFARITLKNDKGEEIFEVRIDNQEKKIELVVFKILSMLKDLSLIKLAIKMRRSIKSEDYTYKFRFKFKLLGK